jgi:hypothetical protein
MCKIAESNVLLRAQAELPTGFKVATEEFRDGWNRMRSGGARRLERKVLTRGWNFIRIADGTLRSGVGDTSQKAIASALKLALRRADTRSNAVEVEQIELTQYPWFFLATVRVHPYRIQRGAALPAPDGPAAAPMASPRSRASSRESGLYPELAGAMPMLKEMLTASVSASGSLTARTQ